MTLALLHELLELAALGVLIAGGVCIAALLLHVLLLAAGFGKDRPREYRMYELLGKLKRLFSRRSYEPMPEREERLREILTWVEGRLTEYEWLDSETLTDTQLGQTHPYDWRPREPMIWSKP